MFKCPQDEHAFEIPTYATSLSLFKKGHRLPAQLYVLLYESSYETMRKFLIFGDFLSSEAGKCNPITRSCHLRHMLRCILMACLNRQTESCLLVIRSLRADVNARSEQGPCLLSALDIMSTPVLCSLKMSIAFFLHETLPASTPYFVRSPQQ